MSRPLYTLPISPTSLASIRHLQNHVLTMPNRIENIRIRAANSAVKKLKTYLENTYKNAGRGMTVKSDRKSQSIRIRISAEPASFSNGGVAGADKRKFAANMLMYGRKSYSSRRGGGDKPYKLRAASSPPYPTHLASFKVRRMPPNEAARRDIRNKAQALLMESIIIAASREGFGPRGGNPAGMSDTAHTTRSVSPNEGSGR